MLLLDMGCFRAVTLSMLIRFGRAAARWKAMDLKRPKMRSICEKHDLEATEIGPKIELF